MRGLYQGKMQMTSLLHAYLIVSNGNLLYCVFASQMLHIRKKWAYQQSEFEILFNISLCFNGTHEQSKLFIYEIPRNKDWDSVRK